MDSLIKRLRDRKSVRLFDKKERLFINIQLNKTDNRICWERWVSKDKKNWVNWNLYLSLKDVLQIQKQIILNNTK
jgi:hypothetical protein